MRFFSRRSPAGLLILCLALLHGCGYRPAAGRLVADLEEDIRFLPFLAENRSPDLSLSHSVTRGAHVALGRRNALASRGEEEAFALRLVIHGVSETPVAYSPVGGRLRYQGRLRLSYALVPPAETQPIWEVSSETIRYRYDQHFSPQITQQHRMEAIEGAVEDWVPGFLMRAGAAIADARLDFAEEESTSADEVEGLEEGADS